MLPFFVSSEEGNHFSIRFITNSNFNFTSEVIFSFFIISSCFFLGNFVNSGLPLLDGGVTSENFGNHRSTSFFTFLIVD